MGKFCEVCQKGVSSGNNVSHSNRVIVGGAPKRMSVCTRCLRSGKVERAI